MDLFWIYKAFYWFSIQKMKQEHIFLIHTPVLSKLPFFQTYIQYQLVISNISVFPSFVIRFPLLNLICVFFLNFLKHFIAILFYHLRNQITTSFKSFIHSTPPSNCIKMVLPDTHFVSHKCFSGYGPPLKPRNISPFSLKMVK